MTVLYIEVNTDSRFSILHPFLFLILGVVGKAIGLNWVPAQKGREQ